MRLIILGKFIPECSEFHLLKTGKYKKWVIINVSDYPRIFHSKINRSCFCSFSWVKQPQDIYTIETVVIYNQNPTLPKWFQFQLGFYTMIVSNRIMAISKSFLSHVTRELHVMNLKSRHLSHKLNSGFILVSFTPISASGKALLIKVSSHAQTWRHDKW